MGKQKRRRGKLMDWIGGPDPASKRHMSGLLMGVGVLLIPLSRVSGWEQASPWLMGAGVFSMVLGWAGANAAAGQASIEGRASDLIEWKREEQQFRTILRRLWPSLSAVYVHYGDAHQLSERDFHKVVDEAGWPAEKKDESAVLRTFVERCLSFDWGFPVQSSHAVLFITEHLGRDGEQLQLDVAKLHDLVEVCGVPPSVEPLFMLDPEPSGVQRAVAF
jgi:hypothetical protein